MTTQDYWENGTGDMMGGGMSQMMGMGMGSGMGMWMILWWLIGLAVLVLAVLGIIWLVRKQGGSAAAQPSRQGAAEEVLRRRYATGELDEEEYLRRLAVLSDGSY